MGSVKAGERVMTWLRRLYAGLKLQINEAKSAVASAFGRKFLSYALWVDKGAKKSNAKWPTSQCKTSRPAFGSSRAARVGGAWSKCSRSSEPGIFRFLRCVKR